MDFAAGNRSGRKLKIVGRNVATLFGLSTPVMKAARSLRR